MVALKEAPAGLGRRVGGRIIAAIGKSLFVLLLTALTAYAREPAGGTQPSVDELNGFDPLFNVVVIPVPPYGVAPLTVGFHASVTDTSADPTTTYSYRWTFGDGATSAGAPAFASHTYQHPGTYVVTLMISAADGRTALGAAAVTVRQPSVLDHTSEVTAPR